MNERRLTPVERYRQYQALLMLPTFDTVEEAKSNLQVSEGTFVRFMLRQPLGVRDVCTAYIGQSRDNPPAWTHRVEYSVSPSQVYAARVQAIIMLGTEQLGEEQ